MRRRDFVALSCSAVVTCSTMARAQQPAKPMIGYLGSGTPDAFADGVAGFRQTLKDFGFTEGQNVAIEYRWAQNQYARLPTLAAELVDLKVAMIMAGDTASALAAKAATATIPIVFSLGADPVKIGLVASLSRPGGNITGVTFLINSLGSKRLELLRDLVPAAAAIGFLADPTNPNTETETTDMLAAAGAVGRKLLVERANTESEVDAAFASLVQQRADALIIAAQAFFLSWRDQLAALAARHSLPTIYPLRAFAVSGGLMGYGPSISDAFRQAGLYAGRILKGERPADLPVSQSTRFELVINLKTAKELGLTVPPTLQVAADEMIE